MKMSLRAVSLLPCLALLLAVAPAAHSATVTVGLYQGAILDGQSLPSTPYSGVATYTGTVTNSTASNLFNFYTTTDKGPDLFLTTGTNSASNGDTVTGSISLTSNTLGFNDSIWVFTGTTYLDGSANDISFMHDDGVNVFLNGSSTCTLCAGAPSNATSSSATVAAGNYSFVIDYSEVNGNPGVLKGTIGTLSAPAPEPSGLILLGTGVLGAAGMFRRRFLA